MDNFNLKKFLTENKLTKVSKLTETMHGSVDPAISNEVHNILRSYDDNDDPELGHWKQDPTHVLEQIIEILQENGIEVPSGMFHDRMYQAVDELVRHTRDLQFIADSLIEFVLDPGMYQSGLQEAPSSSRGNYQVEVTEGSGEEILSTTLEGYPDFETALFDVVQDLVSEYYADIDDYLGSLEGFGDTLTSVQFNSLSQVLNYEVKQAGGLSNVMNNGMSLAMPNAGRGEVFIKITPI